jgi:hypothetical protein
VLGAFIEGWRRVFSAPWMTAGLLISVLGLLAEVRVPGAVIGWMFVHELFAFGGRTVDVAADIVRGQDTIVLLTSTVSVQSLSSLLWLFMSGGVLDRFARARPIGTAAFFAASGVYFLRFLRLGAGLGLVYWTLFEWVYPLLVARFTAWSGGLAPREAPALRITMYTVVLLLLAVVGVVSDFAKVRSVVEDRHSMFGAVAAAFRFVRRRFLRVLLLYGLNTAVMIGIVTISQLWRFQGPPLLFILTTALLLIWTRLAFMASSIAFFQGELAHANYTAAPLPLWPDSPAAEAIENLAGQRADGK